MSATAEIGLDVGDEVVGAQERLCRARNMVARQAAIVRLLQRHNLPTAAATAALAALESALEGLEAIQGSRDHVAARRASDAIVVFAMRRQPASAVLSGGE
jgi:hypothetical protein